MGAETATGRPFRGRAKPAAHWAHLARLEAEGLDPAEVVAVCRECGDEVTAAEAAAKGFGAGGRARLAGVHQACRTARQRSRTGAPERRFTRPVTHPDFRPAAAVVARLLIASDAEPTPETVGLLEPWDGEIDIAPAGADWPGQWIATVRGRAPGR